jgi:NADPH2:quinone reductase
MKAVVMHAPGDPEVLEPAEVADPAPAATELLVRLHAAGVNPIDTKLRGRGTYFPDRAGPAILGCDGAGVVEAVGEQVTRFRPGDAVYFCNGGIGGHPGTYAERATVDERFAAPKPESLDFTQAAAAPLVAITAWEALFDRAGLSSDQRALVHAGAGGVGHMAVQLARHSEAQVAATVGDEDKARFVDGLGATPIPYREVDLVEAVRAWSEEHGADVVLDTVGPAVLEAGFPALAFYGQAVTLLDPKGVDFKQARLRNAGIHLELMLTPMYFGLTDAQIHQGQILTRCSQLFDAGQLSIHVASAYPLEQAAEAHAAVEGGHMTGKVALTIP